MNWTAAENAIVAEIKLALPTARIIWRDQTRSVPVRPYVALAWLDAEPEPNTAPVTTYSDTPGAPAGAEITITTRSLHQARLQVEVYSSAITTDAAALPLALRVASQLTGLDSAQRLSALAHISLDNASRVQSVPDIYQTEHESRALLQLTVNFSVESVSTVTFVEIVGIEVNLDNNGATLARQFDVP